MTRFFRFACTCLLATTTLLAASAFAQTSVALSPYTQIKHPPIPEMSGIIKSRRYTNTYWVHNDSGNDAHLFAIHADGSVVMPPWLKSDFFADIPDGDKKPYPGIKIEVAANIDWEDIAIDDDMLYIAETGNNNNARRDLGVYKIAEPDPNSAEATRPMQWIPIAYPDQKTFPQTPWHFDCEAIFVLNHKLYFLTKWRIDDKWDQPGTGTTLYRLETQHTDKVNILKKLDTREDLGGWVTAADVSPDGKVLAVLCEAPVKSIWLFDISSGGDRLLSRPKAHLVLAESARQCEAICFDDNQTLIVGNENRNLFRIPVSAIPVVTP